MPFFFPCASCAAELQNCVVVYYRKWQYPFEDSHDYSCTEIEVTLTCNHSHNDKIASNLYHTQHNFVTRNGHMQQKRTVPGGLKGLKGLKV